MIQKIKLENRWLFILIFFCFSTNLHAIESYENYDKYKNLFKKTNSKEKVLFKQDFEACLLGKYSPTELNRDFLNPQWSQGVSDGRTSIVQDDDSARGKVLRVLYPAHGVASKTSGASWRMQLPGSFEKLYFAYRVKFDKEFSFAKGGKLPGFLGGTDSSGLRKSDGKTGFSTRMMWFEKGRVTSYVYHTDQLDKHGDIMDWTSTDGAQISFKPNVWYAIEQKVVMNTPGSKNGEIHGWIDGKPAFKKTRINFRNVSTYAIDSLFFSTFFGGHTKDFESPRDQYASFDDLIIAQEPIWNATKN